MPSLLGHLLLLICCLCGDPSWAAQAWAGESIALDDNTPALQIQSGIKAWLDEGSHATIALVAGDTVNFKSDTVLERYPLNKYDTLWMKLRVKRAVGSTSQWTLNVPLPFVDFVTLYQTCLLYTSDAADE